MAAIDPQTCSFADAEAELQNRVYAAAQLLEELEQAGRVYGNGHHARQRVAAAATEELRNRWRNRDEVPPTVT